jgi:hypothetical protein
MKLRLVKIIGATATSIDHRSVAYSLSAAEAFVWVSVYGEEKENNDDK